MNSRDILFKELKNYSTSDISNELHFADEIAKLLYALTDESDVSLIVDKVEKERGTYPISLLEESFSNRKVFFQYLLNNYFKLSDVKPDTYEYKASCQRNLVVVLGIVSEFTNYACVDEDTIYISVTSFIEKKEENIHLTEEFIKNAERALVSKIVKVTGDIYPRRVVQLEARKYANFLRELVFDSMEEKQHFVKSIYSKFLKDKFDAIIKNLYDNYSCNFAINTKRFRIEYHDYTVSDALEDFYHIFSIPKGSAEFSLEPLS